MNDTEKPDPPKWTQVVGQIIGILVLVLMFVATIAMVFGKF